MKMLVNFFIFFTLVGIKSALAQQDLCPLDSPDQPPCNGPEFRTCPGRPNYRRFCDHDGSVLDDGKLLRTICAPCNHLDQFLQEGDYCGDCKPATNAPSDAPVTITDAPVTGSPITESPITPVPVTTVPVTSSPVSPAPVTPAPVTPGPITPAPVTEAPVTPAPVTAAPVSPAPVTASPVTPEPVTPAPVTEAPVTASPVTPEPVTPAPVSPAPVTPAPVTSAPVTPAPVTAAPVTPAPVSPAPVTPDTCIICGDGKYVGNPDGLIDFTMFNFPVYECGLLQQAGYAGGIPTGFCSFVQTQTADCDCIPTGAAPASPAPPSP